jgi:uncharacterized membrane protein required for colicin V production
MRITFFDVLFLFALIGGAAWGFYRGVFRQAASTLVLYVSTVVSTLTYRSLSRMMGDTGQSASATDLLAFIILMAVTNLLFVLIANDLLKNLDENRMPIWVNLSGMVFGFVNAAVWCAVILIILRSATGGSPWMGYEGVRLFIRGQTRGSWMAYVFRPFMRFIIAIIQPWLFGRELPPLFVNAL